MIVSAQPTWTLPGQLGNKPFCYRIHYPPLDDVRETSGGYGINGALQASIYNSQKRWEVAEVLQMPVKEIPRQVPREERRDRLTGMRNLAPA